MVLINIISSFILGLFIFVFKIKFHKKNQLIWILLMISILPLISLLRQGTYESGDFNLHIYRAMSFYDSLRDGVIFPSWASDLNAKYGYPLFIFINPLPYYLISFFHFLGFSFIASMKIFLSILYILSGIAMYFLCKDFFKNNFFAFSAAIFYLFTPYHLIDLHFRVDIGENLFFAIFPLFFLFLKRFFDTNKKNYLFLSCTFFSYLIFAHQAIALLSLLMIITPFTIFYIFKKRENRFFLVLNAIFIFLIGSLISSPSWIPYIFYTKYTYLSKIFFTISYPDIFDLLLSPWRFGFLFQGHIGEISPLIGYTQILIILFCLLFLVKNKFKKNKQNLVFFLIISFVLLFLMTPLSKFIWEFIPLIRNSIMTTRLLLILSFCVSILAGILFENFAKKWKLIILFLIVTIMYTILNWGHRRVMPEINDSVLRQNLPLSTFEGEGLNYIATPKWIKNNKLWFHYTPNNTLEILSGSSEIKEIRRTSIEREYIIFANKGNTLLKENTTYFPGWEVKVNNEEKNIINNNDKYPGLILFKVNEGLSKITIKYEDLLWLKVLKIVSLIILLFIDFQIIFTLIKKS